MNRWILSIPILLFVGCATASEITLPNGNKGFSVACNSGQRGSLGTCYEKAGQVCPSGYEVVEKDVAGQAAVAGFYGGASQNMTILIECRDHSASSSR